MLYHIYFSEAFSLFSIVQFPNQQCTASSSSTTYGTCYTSSECTSKGGSSDGNCAAGFGVCCELQFYINGYFRARTFNL